MNHFSPENENKAVVQKNSIFPLKPTDKIESWSGFGAYIWENLVTPIAHLTARFFEAKVNAEETNQQATLRLAQANYEKIVAETESIKENTRGQKIENDFKEKVIASRTTTQELLEKVQNAMKGIEAKGGVVEFQVQELEKEKKPLAILDATVAYSVGFAEGEQKVEDKPSK